jgi:hypothetical protein
LGNLKETDLTGTKAEKAISILLDADLRRFGEGGLPEVMIVLTDVKYAREFTDKI